MENVAVSIIKSDEDLNAAFAIRRAVFTDEQGVSEADEFDGLDDGATQYLMTLGGLPVGTARSRQIDASTCKIERVAVVRDQRGQGLGRAIMDDILARLKGEGMATAMIHAQEGVIPFYLDMGFVGVGDHFMEAGIRHLKMEMKLL